MFARTLDYELVRAIITHPKVWGGRPGRDVFAVRRDASIWYVLPLDSDSNPRGVFVFIPLSRRVWEAHMCLLPVAWGRRSAALVLACTAWFGAQTGCSQLLAEIPESNRLMHALARRLGMRRHSATFFSLDL